MTNTTETIIDLMRHGEPEGGRAYRGHNINDPLSEKGWQQMWDAVGKEAPWDQIVTSPLQRCRAFAEALVELYNLPCYIEENFKEVGFGSWEGRTPDEIKADNLKEYEDFYHDPVNCRPAGAENLNAFITRVRIAYDNTIEKYAGKHILIVAHAGVNRAIIAHALHTAPIGLYRIKVNNAGLSRIKNDHLGNHLLYHNVQLADMT
ncbi:MAG: alpha-ribazole phosphatase family protein [Gammaproteobacteria bacterium]|nr:alpha-ribazole phosphatase family protein [Gammaproteobacteria bacterium]